VIAPLDPNERHLEDCGNSGHKPLNLNTISIGK
jgi:hypothetical protein